MFFCVLPEPLGEKYDRKCLFLSTTTTYRDLSATTGNSWMCSETSSNPTYKKQGYQSHDKMYHVVWQKSWIFSITTSDNTEVEQFFIIRNVWFDYKLGCIRQVYVVWWSIWNDSADMPYTRVSRVTLPTVDSIYQESVSLGRQVRRSLS
jgi:hypothetical protein